MAEHNQLPLSPSSTKSLHDRGDFVIKCVRTMRQLIQDFADDGDRSAAWRHPELFASPCANQRMTGTS
jgi:hypothetical protein